MCSTRPGILFGAAFLALAAASAAAHAQVGQATGRAPVPAAPTSWVQTVDPSEGAGAFGTTEGPTAAPAPADTATSSTDSSLGEGGRTGATNPMSATTSAPAASDDSSESSSDAGLTGTSAASPVSTRDAPSLPPSATLLPSEAQAAPRAVGVPMSQPTNAVWPLPYAMRVQAQNPAGSPPLAPQASGWALPLIVGTCAGAALVLLGARMQARRARKR
ncbi:MAG: hypothetical protein M3O50_05060 [Myxococcota bacterium]|nr:hypothetical protein [Myxococcota bacterium]